jgi:hypothetical protein
MRPSNTFQLEWVAEWARRRALAFRMALALLLGLPFAVVDMPPRAQAVGLAMLVVFVAFFGSAVALTRRRVEGQWERLRLLPLPRWQVVLDHILASGLVDTMQLAPVMLLFAAANGQGVTASGALTLAAWLIGTVLVLNALGVALACGMQSNAEVHLAAALGVAIIVALSGFVPLPARLLPVSAAAAAWSPVAGLAARLEAAAAPSRLTGHVWLALLVLCAVVAAVLWRAGCLGGQRGPGALE